MLKLSDQETRQLLEAGTERRNLEFKSSFEWGKADSTWIQEQVVRAVLAMTNTPLGGQIVIGIEEINSDEGKKLNFTGLTEQQIHSFEDIERIKGIVDGFSSVDTSFSIYLGQHEGLNYVVISVQEFYDIPALCKKNGSTRALVRYDMYTRSRRAPFSSSKVTELELREIVQMAADKEKETLKTRKYVKLSATQKTSYDNEVKDML